MFINHFSYRNKAALVELLQITGGKKLKSAKFTKECHTWVNAPTRKLGWSLGDVEAWVNRLRTMFFHARDAVRDGRMPPDHLSALKAILNMISVEAITETYEDEDEANESPDKKNKTIPSSEPKEDDI